MATGAASKTTPRAALLKQRDQLDAERRRIEAEIVAQSQADLQDLVNAFLKHLKDNDFALADALRLLEAGRKTRAKRGSAKVKGVADRPRPGVTYAHPKTGEEWSAPVNLRRVKKWLVELVQATGKTYEDFATKKKSLRSRSLPCSAGIAQYAVPACMSVSI